MACVQRSQKQRILFSHPNPVIARRKGLALKLQLRI